MTKELTQFKYEQLDDSTADFLRDKETNMREIVGKAYTELGRELTEARDRLAGSNQYDGVFIKWVESIGMQRRQVTRLIQRYEMLGTLCPDQTGLIEDLPVTLTYEIARPNSEDTPAKAQAKAEVLAGDITTGKAYEERIKELERKTEQAEQQAEIERRERERLEAENEELSNREPDIEMRTEYVEIDNTPSDYDDVKRRLEKYHEKFGDIRDYDGSVTATHVQDMISATMSFKKAVKEIARRFSYMTKYKDAINRMDHISKQEYNETVKALHEMADSFEYLDGDNSRVIIEQQ